MPYSKHIKNRPKKLGLYLLPLAPYLGITFPINHRNAHQ